MSAPKKIWMVKETCWLNHDQPSGDIPYIREDIVLELVESLQKCWMVMNGGGTWTLEDQDKTKAALAKARGEA